MRMSSNHTEKKNSTSDPNSSKRISGQRHQSDPTQGSTEAVIAAAALAAEQHGHHIEPDLFSILSSMHLTNQQSVGAGSSTNQTQVISMPHPVIVASRKRKILDGGHGSVNGSGAGKMNGMRPPAHRRTSDDDEDVNINLQTPHCSQSGMLYYKRCMYNVLKSNALIMWCF